jgi:hypothetical protein
VGVVVGHATSSYRKNFSDLVVSSMYRQPVRHPHPASPWSGGRVKRAVRQFEKAEVQALKPLLREILQLSTSTVSQPGFFLSRLFECSEQSLDLRGVARMR